MEGKSSQSFPINHDARFRALVPVFELMDRFLLIRMREVKDGLSSTVLEIDVSI